MKKFLKAFIALFTLVNMLSLASLTPASSATVPVSEPLVSAPGAPDAPSPVITGLSWAPASTILRKAAGSDNWPVTWGDDDHLYTAYGDGSGFDSQTVKLSLGFARISGPAAAFTGANLRSQDEQLAGEGSSGKKASGMLMVKGVLYMWARNANQNGEQCQLAWSGDRAKTWEWAGWKFAEFGTCTFINYGKDYAGARDAYIYTVTHDHPSAYESADRFILMRVPASRIAEREAYEFFESLDGSGSPVWTSDLDQRGAVFTQPDRARRSGISYNQGLKRYLWWQGLRSGGSQSGSGFAIYDAPEPWGPWTTVFHTGAWDVDPGETGSFPTKWMSADGKELYLVFSGDDSFSVRKAVLMSGGGAPSRIYMPGIFGDSGK